MSRYICPIYQYLIDDTSPRLIIRFSTLTGNYSVLYDKDKWKSGAYINAQKCIEMNHDPFRKLTPEELEKII